MIYLLKNWKKVLEKFRVFLIYLIISIEFYKVSLRVNFSCLNLEYCDPTRTHYHSRLSKNILAIHFGFEGIRI